MKFIEKTGYLPVTKQAFEQDMAAHMETLEDARIKKMLTAVLSMYEEYTFFTAPNYSNLDADSASYETSFKSILTKERSNFLTGSSVSAEAALNELRK